MTSRRLTVSGDPRTDDLNEAFAAIRVEFGVPESFPADVEQAARNRVEQMLAHGPIQGRRDCTDVPFFTIDPPGSRDLDQAICLERRRGPNGPGRGGGVGGGGFRLRYAIADVAAYVTPQDPVDLEARRRGSTVYLPDRRTPLHPPVLSESAASLLPDVDRPAYVWDLELDADAEPVGTAVYPAVIRSRVQLDYQGAQRDLEAGTGMDALVALAEFGRLRAEAELARGGASLPKPDQEVVAQDGHYQLRYRPIVPLEDHNAHVSLLTGMTAAQLMLEGGIGILRTMPPAPAEVMERFRRQAMALGVPWPDDLPYGAFLRTLDRADPAHLAVIHAATTLFRGAGYHAFDESAGKPRPEQSHHAAVAAPYAHVTAPLRRLVDRFALAGCAALCAGEGVPEWVTAALPTLPDIMRERDRIGAAVDRAATDAVEAAVLSDRVGETFTATVLEVRSPRKQPDGDPPGGDPVLVIQLADPAVEARCAGTAEAGTRIQVRLVAADVAARSVRFEAISTAAEDRSS